MTITLNYYVTFGLGHSNEWTDWEVELTPEEETAIIEGTIRAME